MNEPLKSMNSFRWNRVAFNECPLVRILGSRIADPHDKLIYEMLSVFLNVVEKPITKHTHVDLLCGQIAAIENKISRCPAKGVRLICHDPINPPRWYSPFHSRWNKLRIALNNPGQIPPTTIDANLMLAAQNGMPISSSLSFHALTLLYSELCSICNAIRMCEHDILPCEPKLVRSKLIGAQTLLQTLIAVVSPSISRNLILRYPLFGYPIK